MWVILHFYTISGGWYSFRVEEPVTLQELTQVKEKLETYIDAGKGFYSGEKQCVFLKNVEALSIEEVYDES